MAEFIGVKAIDYNAGLDADTRKSIESGLMHNKCLSFNFLLSGANHYLGAPKALLFWQRMADLPSAAPPPMSYSEDAWPRCNARARLGQNDLSTYE